MVNEEEGSGMLSISSSSHQMIISTTANNYHVFLSFRGEDTRHTFTDHLYTALVHAGFRTFRDDDDIERGEDVTSELQNAIRQSRSSIIVFSKDYASSRWCLDELCLILERRRAAKHVVLPVFYDVNPSEVRKQTGSFAKAFQRHEKKYSKVEVKKWRVALGEAADLAGMVLKNEKDGHESKFIHKIIRVIGEKLYQAVSILGPNLIGMETRAREINQWLQDRSSDVGIAAICGMGGIGKTTVAKLVFNMNLKYFEGGCFLDEIRETWRRSDGLVHLQKQLLSSILKGKDVEKIWSVDEGIVKIQDSLCNKRILLVLDDVDHIDQINAIFGMRNWFLPGSKIIITTRHEHLLRARESYNLHGAGMSKNAITFRSHEFCRVYNVGELSFYESHKLFNRYAFGQDDPVEGYEKETNRIVNYCGGLPLALIVLGRSLRGRSSIDVWRSTADKLQAIPHMTIMDKLMISYDSLHDDHDKNLFLHIACFFIGRNKNSVVEILDECEFYTTAGIENLIDRCLLYVDVRNKLRMHQLLRDMGREIVRLESPKEPGKRSRLWHYKDCFKVLREKSGTETIEGFFIDHMHVNDFARKNYKSPHESDLNRDCNADISKVSRENKIEFEADAFIGMKRLAILQLKHVKLAGSYEKIPKTLRWLSWQGFPQESIPDSLHLENVMALVMRCSSLKRIWTQSKFLESLKILDLRRSYDLTESPDFSWVPNLERLVLKYCTSLVEIHESVGCLQNLFLMNLKGCKKLEKLPNNISMMKGLENLDISGCSNVKHLADMRKLESLKVFLADGLDISQLLSPSSNTEATDMVNPSGTIIIIKPRQNPEFSWAACLPTTLVRLSLRNCNLSDDDFPMNFCHFSSLKELDLRENLFSSLPDFIRHLRLLEELNFRRCANLQYLEGLPKVEGLDVEFCTSLKKITFDQSPDSEPVAIAYSFCNNLVEVGKWFKMEPLESVNKELITALGLNELEFPKNKEVILMNLYGFPSQSPLQGFLEPGGMFTTFIPGEEIPAGSFDHICDGSTVYLTVPACHHHNQRVRGLNICAVYSHPSVPNEQEALHITTDYFQKALFPYDLGPLFLKVTNITTSLKLVYHPLFYGISKNGEHMRWFCHWKFEDDIIQLEEGNRLCVSFVVDDAFHVKKTGVSFMVGQDYDTKSTSTCAWGAGVDLSPFYVKPGVFFFSWRRMPKNYDWLSPDCLQVLFGDPKENTDTIATPDSYIEVEDSAKGNRFWKSLIIASIGIFFIFFCREILWWFFRTQSSSSDLVCDKRLQFPT